MRSSRKTTIARRRALAFVWIAIICVATSCTEATQVTIEARTNVAHQNGYVVTFTVGGAPEDTELAAATTESVDRWGTDGLIGSLAVVPRNNDSGAVAVKVVLGVRGQASRECAPPEYRGCIVARRRLRYLRHKSLRLPIALYAQCEGVPCDRASTCNILGQCVSSEINPEACNTDRGCHVDGDDSPSSTTPTIDGGPQADASETGSPIVSDGGGDGGADAADAATKTGKIECGPSGPNQCDVGAQYCCAALSTYEGVCQTTGSMCPGLKMACDGPEDCSALAPICCSSVLSGSACVLACTRDNTLCHDGADCPNGVCNPPSDGYYRLCNNE